MKFTKLAIAMMSTAALAACGGGGGSGSSGNNNVQPDPNPNPDNEQGSVVQAFQFDAFSSQDVADAVTSNNFNANSKTAVCLDTDSNGSCFGEQYKTEGTGLSFSGNLEWPDTIDTSGLNILAENNEFTYSIPADSGIGAVAQAPSSQRVKVYINPVTNAGSDSRLGPQVLLQKYDGDKYTKVTFDPTSPYNQLDQEIKTLGDTVTSMVQSASAQSISDADLKNIVSGALGAIIEALQDSGVSDVQIVINVIQNNGYDNLRPAQEGNSAPVASFTFEVGADGWVTFTNSSSDPDNDNVTFKWKFGDGAESSEVSPKHQYTRNGSFSVYLGASDDKNALSYATKHVNVNTVSAADQEAASFTVTAATDGSGKVTVANASTVENVKEFRWDFGDGTGAVSGENPDHTYAKSGSYTVKLQIITKTGVKFTDSHAVSVTVNSVTPVNPDPVNPDPINPDPVNPDPVNPDPVNPDPVNPDPVNPDPVIPSVCTDSDPYCKGNIDPEGCEQQCTEQQVEVDCAAAGSQSVATVQGAGDVSSEALSSIEMAGIYATNPNGQVGKNKTISSMSDWTSDMLIAQGAANDDPRAYRGYHEKATDFYGLYAAWDDTNLYLMVELPNLSGAETGGDFDYSNDKFLPMGIGIRTGKRPAGDGEMVASSDDRLPWIKEKLYSIKEGIDALLMFHPQEYHTPGLFLTNDQGEFSYDSKGGYLLGFKDVGIVISDGVAGSVSPTYMGVSDNYGKDGNAWKTESYQDLKNENGGFLKQLTIPLAALGIDKSYLESHGISVMAFSTFGTSMMDALPWTPNLVDKASEAYSKDVSTSAEKEDMDIYDVHLASVGKLQTGGVTPVTPVNPVEPDPISPDPQVCYQKKVVCTPATLPAQCNSTDAIEVSLSHSESTADAAVTTAVKVATGYKGITYKWSTSDGQSATTSYDGTSKSFTFKRGKADKTVTVTVTASNSSGSRTGTQSFTVSVPACANCSAPAPVDNAWVNVLDQVDSNIYVDNGTASTCKAPEGAVILKHDGFANPTLWLYQDKTNYTGGTWPGASMTKIDGCTSTFYSFTPSESVSSASAIFSDAGNNQYPGQNQPGVEFTTAKPCFDYEAKAFKSADECGLAAAEVTDSAYIFVDGSKKTDGVITISQKDDSEASGYKDISLMMAGKGVNAETTGTFYFGDDASKAAEFVNGQKIRVGENITATEEGTETKLTVIYKDAKATYTIKKIKWTAPVVGDVQFSWNNAYMYFVVTDRFQNGDTSNDGSYGRPKTDGKGHATATFHGGDIKGLTDRLDYIKSLGINAIWLTAPYEQAHGWTGGGSSGAFAHYAYHGYYALDFTTMDANMGTITDFRNFVTEAHKRGIRVVVDIVMNHSGYATLKDMCEFKFGNTTDGSDPCTKVDWVPGGGESYHSKPISEDQNSKWDNWWGKNWIIFGGYGEQCGAGDGLDACVSYLPDFKNSQTHGGSVAVPGFLQSKWATADAAHDVPAAKQYRSGNMSVAEFQAHWLASWVEEFGIDGFRCDTAKHVTKSTWKLLKEYSQEALQKWRQAHAGGDDPAASWTDDFYMTGEHWGFQTDPSDSSGYGSQGGFTAMINFSFNGQAKGGSCSVPNASTWSDYAQKFNNGTSAPKLNALSYVSSHDTSLCRPGDMKALGTGLGLLPGGVQVYYGDETGRPNDNGGSGNDAEHGTRSDMNFPSDIGSQASWAAKVDTLSTEFSSDATLAHWQKVGQFRFRNPAVGAGRQTALSDGSLCRTYNDGQGIDNAVVIHVGSASSVDVSGCFEDGTELQDGYSGATGTVSGGKVSLSGTKDLILLELKR